MRLATKPTRAWTWKHWLLIGAAYLLLIVISLLINHPAAWLALVATAMALGFVYIRYQDVLAKATLEERLQEYSMLNEISLALRTTLDLDNLLTVIQQQVTRLLGVDNFYVALYDEADQYLWFPLAVRHSQRCQWGARSLSPEKLTDRVIHTGEALVMKPGSVDSNSRAGLPAGEEDPHAWMGVPLATLDKAFGCLAIYSFSDEDEFSEQALNLLNILSGQVSVAIENVLMYKREQRRASLLENLNRINTLITSSLDPEEVLSSVCQAAVQVGGGKRSAIFLLDPDQGILTLARSTGLSENFCQNNACIPISNNVRMRCLRSGRPVQVNDLAMYVEEPEYKALLAGEGVRAFAEFPLVTPDGRAGYLVVYYDAPHSLRNDEVHLMQTFANQAAMAVRHAHKYSFADLAMQRRANQVAILESVGRELSAAISSERLFDMILGYALEFSGSISGEFSLYHRDTGILEVKSSRGYSNPRDLFPADQGIHGRVVKSRQQVNLGDVRGDRDYEDLTGGRAQSQLCVPVFHEERVVGVLSLESDRTNAYNPADQAFISQIANQAAVAIVNADLYAAVQARLREQSILYLVSQQFLHHPEFDKVIQTLARSSEAFLETHAVGIYLWNEEDQCYHSAFTSTTGRATCRLQRVIPLANLETIQSGLMKTGALVLPAEKNATLLCGCKECQALVFPLITAKQRIGMMLLHLDVSMIVKEDQQNVLRAIVSQAATSMHNAQLFADVSISHDRLAAVLNSVGEGILMVDIEGVIMVANELVQSITGLPRSMLTGHRLTDLPDAALTCMGYSRQDVITIAANLSDGVVLPAQKSVLQGAGRQSELMLERYTSPVWSQDGGQKGWMVILRDVTEEMQITQARELITSTLVHDLRSPVSAVISAVDILEEHLPSTAKDSVSEQAFRVAHNGASRVLGLIESLLDIAKMQSGRMELSLTAISLHQLAEGVLAEQATVATESGIILVNDIPRDLPNVNADHNKMVRIVGNLVDNAIKFSPSGGRVIVYACQTEPKVVEIRIIDNGPGIPEEYREKVFDRFIQVPGSRSRRRGSGLGLTFCQMAIEAHGGKIWVENQPAPHTGSIFVFTLPVG